MTLAERQKQVREWRAKQFPDHTLLEQLAGATGELAGEALQEALKLEDNRVEDVNREAKVKDGIGDTLIYLMGACDLLDTTLEECFELAWGQVQKRGRSSWGKDKKAADDTGATGHAVPQSELRDGFGGIA